MTLFKKFTAVAFILVSILLFGFSSITVFAGTVTTGGSGAPVSTGGSAPAVTTGGSGSSATLPNPLEKNVSSISDLLYLIANIATYIGAILAVLALIWVGFKFVAAQGNPEKISEARRYFFYIVIGVAILIGASAIISILKNTLTSAGVVQPQTFSNPS